MPRDVALDPRLQFLHDRRTVSRLEAPGPDHAELAALLAAADTAPDHGQLHPWRLKVLSEADRARVSDAYVQAQRDRDPTPELVERAASKPLRGPCVVAALARTMEHPKVPAWEQLAAAAAAVQNLCLAATALGYGSAWRTGWFIEHPAVLAAVGADDDERIIGLVHLGTPGRRAGQRDGAAADGRGAAASAADLTDGTP
jgi:nitroreductase